MVVAKHEVQRDKITYKDGADGSKCSTYVGFVLNGVPEDHSDTAHMYFADGSHYQGQFRNGRQQGQGFLLHSDGSRYSGEFKDGLQDGRGALWCPATNDSFGC